jgi:hypothetical protein
MTTSGLELPITQPTVQPESPDSGGTMSWLRERWVAPVAFVGLGVVLFFAYLAQARQLPIFADGASQALQAWDMLHGNLLLHGWAVSDVSFYTTELPQYMLLELVRGLNPDVVHLAGAMTYTLLVLGTALLAKGRATGREALVRVLIPVGIMLAPPLGQIIQSRAISPAWVFFSAPDHTGTQVPLVLIWLVLDRVRPKWWVPLLVAVMLVWVQLADSTALYEGAVPIALVCAIRMYRRRGPLEGQWYDLSLAVGALASAGVAIEAAKLIRMHGGFFVNTAAPYLASASGLSSTLWPKLQDILTLFGADFFNMTITQAAIPLAHLVAVALVVWAVASALRRFFAEDDLAVQVLTASFVVLLAAFMFGYRTGARETVGLLPIGAALAGRLLASRLLQFKLVPALAAVLAFYALTLAHYATQPALPSPDRPLASWLQAHHLTYGLSRTWFASNGVTLYSLGHVKVRDVQISADGKLARLRWNTKASWYDPKLHDARFLILNPCSAPDTGLLVKGEGWPSSVYSVDDFTVLVWDQNLLTGNSAAGSAGVSPVSQVTITRDRDELDRIRGEKKRNLTYRVLCG